MKLKFSEKDYIGVKTKEDYINFYRNKNNAQEYALRDFKRSSKMLTKIETQTIIEISKSRKNLKESSLLDIATGSGRIIRTLESYFKESTGIDTSKTMLSFAKKRTRKSKFFEADIEHLPFKNGQFDVVTCFRLLINMPQKNRLKMFSEVKRVLKKEGIFLGHIHLNKLSLRGFKDIITKKRSSQKVLSFFDIKSELETVNLEVFQVQGSNIQTFSFMFPFLPKKLLLQIDMAIGSLPILNIFCDNLVIAAQKNTGKTN